MRQLFPKVIYLLLAFRIDFRIRHHLRRLLFWNDLGYRLTRYSLLRRSDRSNGCRRFVRFQRWEARQWSLLYERWCGLQSRRSRFQVALSRRWRGALSAYRHLVQLRSGEKGPSSLLARTRSSEAAYIYERKIWEERIESRRLFGFQEVEVWLHQLELDFFSKTKSYAQILIVTFISTFVRGLRLQDGIHTDRCFWNGGSEVVSQAINLEPPFRYYCKLENSSSFRKLDAWMTQRLAIKSTNRYTCTGFQSIDSTTKLGLDDSLLLWIQWRPYFVQRISFYFLKYNVDPFLEYETEVHLWHIYWAVL